MSTMYPYQTQVVRLYHPEILPSPIVIELSDLIYYTLAACLQASQTFLEQGNAFESDRCFDIMQSLMNVDPADEYTVAQEMMAFGFNVSVPIDCLFVNVGKMVPNNGEQES